MTGVVYILAAAVLGLTGLAVYLAVTAFTTSGKLGDSRELAADLKGQLKLAAEKMTEANAATSTALAAEKAQETRADVNEKETADAQAHLDPAGALGRLSNLPDPADRDP